jgi:hypothetical protein
LFALETKVLAQSSQVSVELPLPGWFDGAVHGVLKHSFSFFDDASVFSKALFDRIVRLRDAALDVVQCSFASFAFKVPFEIAEQAGTADCQLRL